MSPTQLDNAALIVSVARRSDLPVDAAAIGLMTAQQESGLLDLDHGDRDSLGLFQQRPSQAWGTPAQLLDPTYAATAFYSRLILVRGWQSMDMADAAQAVQQSKDGSRYRRWEAFGTALATALWTGGDDGSLVCTATTGLPANGVSGTGRAVLAFATQQLGKPYGYGDAGPDSYDCSGLALRAYEAAGIGLPRTSEEQWGAGPQIAQAQLQPGDLVFFDPDPDGRPGHVGIYAGGGYMVDAPHTGAVVRVESVAAFGGYLGAVRPLTGRST